MGVAVKGVQGFQKRTRGASEQFLTDEQDKLLARMHSNGVHAVEMAVKFNIGVSTVYRRIKRGKALLEAQENKE